jgi:hypothetical protein
MKSKTRIKVALVAGIALVGSAAAAHPVVYTFRTVADGQLGSRTFTQALVTFRMRSSTSNVQQQPGPIGGTIWTNATGVATVTVDDGYRTTVATFAPGEVYVHYDTYTGISSFGSSISPTYPVALGCADLVDLSYAQDCVQGDWQTPTPPGNTPTGLKNGIAEGLADIDSNPGDSFYVSDAVFSLPESLAQSTLLTGRVHACAVAYTVLPGGPADTVFELGACPLAAPRGLVTDKGSFFLQDQYGIKFGDDDNTGSLQVEVLSDDD